MEVTGLTERDLQLIENAAASIAEVEELVLFGSRAKGCYKVASDVDLVIKGRLANESSAIRLAEILNEELPLPYFFDVLNYQSIYEPNLLDHIDRVGIVLFDRKK